MRTFSKDTYWITKSLGNRLRNAGLGGTSRVDLLHICTPATTLSLSLSYRSKRGFLCSPVFFLGDTEGRHLRVLGGKRDRITPARGLHPYIGIDVE